MHAVIADTRAQNELELNETEEPHANLLPMKFFARPAPEYKYECRSQRSNGEFFAIVESILDVFIIREGDTTFM